MADQPKPLAEVFLETPNFRIVRRNDADHGYPVYVFETRSVNALGGDSWNPQVALSMSPSARFDGTMQLPIELLVEIFRRLDIEFEGGRLQLEAPQRPNSMGQLGRTGPSGAFFGMRLPGDRPTPGFPQGDEG